LADAHRHLECALLFDDLLADGHVPGLDRCRSSTKLLFPKLHAIAVGRLRHALAIAGCPCRHRRGSGSAGAGHRTLAVAILDVIGAVVAQDPARLVVALTSANGDQRSTATHLALVVVGLILRDAHADQGARDGADAGANRRAGQRRAKGARGDHRADARNGQCADADQPTG
jgi:hypothetical protein